MSELMKCNSNVAMKWKIFKEAYVDYAIATEQSQKEKAIQAATLKSVMGKEC